MDWQRVWSRIELRVAELHMSKREFFKVSGVSDATFAKMRRDGTPLVSPAKRAAVSDVLGWTHDSLKLIAAGGEPVAATRPPVATAESEALLRIVNESHARIATQTKVLSARVDALEIRLEVLERPRRRASRGDASG